MRKVRIKVIAALLVACIFQCRADVTINVRHDDDKLSVDIPKSLLDRDFLMAARVKELSSPSNKGKLYSGQRLYDPIWIQFSCEEDNVIVLRPDDKACCRDTANCAYPAYARNFVTPTWKILPVKKADEESITLDMTTFFSESNEGVDPFGGKLAPGKIIPNSTKILRAKSHDRGIEVDVRYCFDVSGNRPFYAVVRKSLYLLPEKPMVPRILDPRIGYASTAKKIMDLESNEWLSVGYINRFRLTKDDSRYSRIRFYIDDSFPAQWHDAIREGIELWNTAFEEAGFPNVMEAVDYKDAGLDFDPDDMVNNCFRYVVSDFANAMGKHWTDPRSGEIVQAEVMFHSDVIKLLKKWYFLQTAAYNLSARGKELPDSIEKAILRYAAAHEIGHCLGLEHNFLASSAYNVEDLRDPEFTSLYGTTPSIMDYARFNYVAQPGDDVRYTMPPLLGVYDKHAIRIGYKEMPEEDAAVVTKWIDEAIADKMCRYARFTPGVISSNPYVQQSDLGDNPVTAARYGINNLKTIVEQIPSWHNVPENGNPFDGMPASFADLQDNYFGHLTRIIPCIGYDGLSDESVDFLLEQLLQGYAFMIQPNVVDYAANVPDKIMASHRDIVEKMFSAEIAERIYRNAASAGMSYDEFMNLSCKSIFSDITDSIYLRNIQESYIIALKKICQGDNKSRFSLMYVPIAELYLEKLTKLLSKKKDTWSVHLLSLIEK